MNWFECVSLSISELKEARMEQSNEIKNAIELLTANGYEVFHAPFVSISGYIKNMEHDLKCYRQRDEAEREKAKRKEEARKKRQANKEAQAN